MSEPTSAPTSEPTSEPTWETEEVSRIIDNDEHLYLLAEESEDMSELQNDIETWLDAADLPAIDFSLVDWDQIQEWNQS